ncbi:MAG: hypothetical protein JO097_07595 [Acidobacteriaceae bacterium]|nr:hypothetical protein [Acidobacteriaceae bacterium]MBV9767042.1 hypothetical protein [Acidobacteriaceae bacterium]
MTPPEQHRSVIGIRTALILYALLAGASFATLKGMALVIALIIVLGIAAKSYIHFLRGRIE